MKGGVEGCSATLLESWSSAASRLAMSAMRSRSLACSSPSSARTFSSPAVARSPSPVASSFASRSLSSYSCACGPTQHNTLERSKSPIPTSAAEHRGFQTSLRGGGGG
eukprot:3505981-Rhodomonas_salina.2